MKFKKSTNVATYDDLITVDNFFAYLVKEISVAKYGSDKELIPTFSPYKVYQYSDSMLKHLLKKCSQKLRKHYFIAKNQSTTTKPLSIEKFTMLLMKHKLLKKGKMPQI